jgi:hypothetical protein
MDFSIADIFTDSFAKLTGNQQKAVKTTAFDLQMNPAHPSLQFHRLDKPKDKRFWSIRISSDVRLIVHRLSDSFSGGMRVVLDKLREHPVHSGSKGARWLSPVRWQSRRSSPA